MLLLSFLGYSQFNESAPWNVNSQNARQKEVSIDELKTSFDNYWLTHDKNVKGSGHKPFMRWENYWRTNANEQGFIISAEDFWNAWAQKKQTTLNRSALAVPVSNWQPVGPFTHTNTGSWSSGQGRVNYVCVDPSNPNTLYLGAPAGGIWKSTDAGVNWTPLSDNLPQIGVSGIAVDHTNSNVIYISTGDKDAGDSYSIGVLKSTDGGLTWNTTGLTFGSGRSGDIIMHPTNNQILWCATNNGIYKTSNAGVDWTNVQTGSFAKGALRYKPGTPSTVYAVSNNQFYKSINTGDSFSVVTSGLPASSGRLLLDVSAAASDNVYVLSSTTGNYFQGVYRSNDSGSSFTAMNTTTNVFENVGQGSQSWYDLAFAVSQTNANEMYTGCLNVWKSTNGGTSFTKVNNWSSPTAAAYTHADIHYLGFYGNKLYCGSDGGIYVSSNSGFSFTDLTATAQISQFYRVAVSKQSVNNMVGGLQDNGGHGFSGGQWKNYYGADGMDTGINPNNPNQYYGFIQYGGTMYTSSDAANSSSSSVSAPAAETGTNDDGGNWITPMRINNAGEVFAGYERLYRLNGSAWVQQSTGTIGSGNIDVIEIASSDDNIMFVANGSGLYKSTDKGITFSLVYSALSSIESIEVNFYDTSIIYLVTSGSSGQALKSINGGTSFTNISLGLPNIGKNVIVHQGRHTDNPLYVGTNLGVYYIDDTMSAWEPFDTNLPNVAVRDLEINLEDNKIVAATYGRGIWQADIPTQAPVANDIKLVQIVSPTLDLTCDGSVIPSVEIKNNGTNVMTSATINYSIDAANYSFNWTGNLASQASTTVTLPSAILSRGNHNLSVVTTTTNDAYADNNNASVIFYTNDGGTVGQVNPFTNTPSDALISYIDGANGALWQIGSRSGTMSTGFGNTAYVTNLTGNYPDKTKAYLVSQCYNLTNVSNPNIEFKMKFDLENNWDIVYVEYSTDFGANWSVLGTMGANWYNSNRTQATAGNDCYNCPGAQWTGTNTTNTTYTYPLASLGAPSNVIFRIVFHSDDSANQLGVNVDDFVITGTLANESFELSNVAIYPNPSNGLVTVSYGNFEPTQIQVYDISGKLILTKNNLSASETNLDLSSASQGIYFIKISSENQNTVKRLIKN
jgi:hypothetical protein